MSDLWFCSYLLTLLYTTGQLNIALATPGTDQALLMNTLFSNYETDVRPICDKDEPIDVKIGIAIRQIIELDEPKQILYVNAWLRLEWFDCHLQWNASNYSGIDNLIVPYAKVWAPDITLYDNAGEELEGFKDYLVNVQSSGTCLYNFPTVIEALCKIDVTYFPFDTQVCPLKFGSWAHHGMELATVNSTAEGDITSFVPNTEWTLLRVPLEHNILYYQCCPEPYPDVTFYVTMKRKPLFYVLNLLFPCLLITAVALLGFLLPPDAGEKVSLEITVLLSLAVFLLVVSETLPASSENFPFIGVYFAVAMLLVSLSTLLTVIVLNFHHKGDLNRPVPSWIRKVVFQYLGRVMMVRTDKRSIYPAELAKGRSGSQTNNSGSENKAFQQEAYINGYQELQGRRQSTANGVPAFTIQTADNGYQERPLGQEFLERATSPSFTSSNNLSASTSTEPHPSLIPLLTVLKQQLRLMERYESRKENKHRHDHMSSEWKKVGIILDRFFLVLFMTIMVISSMAILLNLSS